MIVNKEALTHQNEEIPIDVMQELHIQLNYVDSLNLPEDEKRRRCEEIMDNFITRHNLGFKFFLIDLVLAVSRQFLIFVYATLYAVVIYYLLNYFIGEFFPNNPFSMIFYMAIFGYGCIVLFSKITKMISRCIHESTIKYQEELAEEEDSTKEKNEKQ